ncbi:MAG: oligoendopeptidase F [Chloroflexaceae bacterium]|nr:oligoendopeptidase F [Chloroflexaceae bacterium]
MTLTLPHRADVAPEYTWSLTDLYATPTDWETAYTAMQHDIQQIEPFRGRLGESPAVLLNMFQTWERLGMLMYRLVIYARLDSDTDTTNQTRTERLNRVLGLATRYFAATSFIEPELLELEPATLTSMVAAAPGLQTYTHFLDDVQRRREHVRSAEIEAIVAQAGQPLGTPWNAYQVLTDGEIIFRPAHDSSGQAHEVAQGTIDALLLDADRTLRKSAWEAYADGFLQVKNTQAALLAGNVQSNIFYARVHNFATARQAALFANNIPVAVFDNLIDACNRHLPIWHRYWHIRRRALGLEKLEVCDIFAPLASAETPVPYQQAVDWICAGLQPLGDAYVQVSRAGMTSGRWVDIYPNRGKRNGAYSNGAYGVHPYILMSYTDNLESMSTLAHELGHALHSYLSNEHQTFLNAGYTIFAAEVASNFNQAMVRAYLLRENDDPAFQIGVIEEAMRNFHRYLFLMPILAQFERTIHERVEHGEALTADGLGALLVGLFNRSYGDAFAIDAERVGITWAQFVHMYMNFYVYQYASGIAAANALADRVLAGEEGIVERYLTFLQAGGSRYPLDALAAAGIDMTSPEPIDRAFAVLEGFVNRLDELTR